MTGFVSLRIKLLSLFLFLEIECVFAEKEDENRDSRRAD